MSGSVIPSERGGGGYLWAKICSGKFVGKNYASFLKNIPWLRAFHKEKLSHQSAYAGTS